MDTSKNKQVVKELYAALEYTDTQALALAHGIGSSAAGTASDQLNSVSETDDSFHLRDWRSKHHVGPRRN